MITKEQKKEIIKKLTDKLSRQKAVLFFDYSGLKVNDFQELRDKLREEKIDCQVGKKTLIDLAFKKTGFKDIKTKEMTDGQIGLVFGYGDEVIPVKILYEFAKDKENLKILTGLINGEYLGAEAINNLAKLPSKQELLAKSIGGIASPLYGLNNALQGNLIKLIYILKNIKSAE
jgi:large subunit ribosomal protein L10